MTPACIHRRHSPLLKDVPAAVRREKWRAQTTAAKCTAGAARCGRTGRTSAGASVRRALTWGVRLQGGAGLPGAHRTTWCDLALKSTKGKQTRPSRPCPLADKQKRCSEKRSARASPAQLIPARRDGDGMSGDMEAAWDCVHKLFKLFDRKQTGPLRPPPPATRTPPCSRERSRSVRVPLPAAGVPSQHPLPRWLATAADTPRPRLPCLQAR